MGCAVTAVELIERLRLKMSIRDMGLAKDDSGWEHRLWRVTLSRPRVTPHGGTMRAQYRTGMGHEGGPNPNIVRVLECLISDAQAGRDSFEEFCGNFGYDTDSRSAELTWKACKSTHTRLARLIGDTAIDELSEALNR